ncbi:MAG: polyprenyl diphosphate synthase [Patescibacteria group bacterium]|jgi:undecaprenyl diphosphate synthase
MEKNIPNHIGIIMDGNRRWAAERNLPYQEGHIKCYEKMGLSSQWFFSRGVKALSFFAFSAESWDRPAEEVNCLMKILRQAIEKEAEQAVEKEYRLIFSGRVGELPGDLPQAVQVAADKTKDGKAGTINICLNYGGRAELVDAIKKMIKNNVLEDQVHEGIIKKYLYNGELPDPDIVVRTSGVEKVSGFLLWEGANSEILFLKKNWPEFEPADADYILNEFNRRRN